MSLRLARPAGRAFSTSARALNARPPTQEPTALEGQQAFKPSSEVYFAEEKPDVKLRPAFTPKGKPQPTRPSRKTRVTLPSGYPEPPRYPPPKEYLEEMDKWRKTPTPHPLWAFFHVPEEAMKKLTAETKFPPDMGSVARLDDEKQEFGSGRSWSAPELRLKSFEDLHTLWYVLLRERNILETQRVERKRLGIPPHYGGKLISIRLLRCRKSMARIKYVLNERRLGAIAAARHTVVAQTPIKYRSNLTVPFALKGVNDPASQSDALSYAHRVPDLQQNEEFQKAVRQFRQKNNAKAEAKRAADKAGKAAAAPKKAEEDMTDAELDALVAQEEAAAKVEAEAEATSKATAKN